MKRLGSHKWLVATGATVAMVVVLSLGAVACDSATDNQVGVGQGRGSQESVEAAAGNAGDTGAAAGQTRMAQRRQDMKERREARADRQQALAENVRDDMSAQDQALYDQLTASVKSQQTAAQDARQELADTLKQLRALVDKYLDLDAPGSN